MMRKSWILLVVAGFASALGPPPHRTEEGSLRSALNAVTRKQRSLESSPDEYYNDLHSLKFYGNRDRERDDDLEFLPFENGQLETIGEGVQKTLPNAHWADEKPKENLNTKLFDKMLLDYLGSEAGQGEPVPSAFRERDRSGSQKRGGNNARPSIDDKQLAKLFLEELQDEPSADSAEVDDEVDLNIFRDWYNDKHNVEPESKADGYNFLNTPMSWGGTFSKQNVKDQDRNLVYVLPAERRNVNGRYPLGREYKEYIELRKRYPVAKRSPKPMPQKRQVTDPKVAQDLGNLFGEKSKRHHDHTHEHDHDHSHSHDHDHKHEQTSEAPNTTTHSKVQDKKVTEQDKPREHPIEIKKKSVDWSQYFGIDRRKKKANLLARPGTQDQDDEWLLQQYYKTMAENLKPSERVANRDSSEKRNMLQQIDSRLKSLEDLIIEEPLRYTGSRDAIDIQKVKDNIMARAAASYSLEKMRRTLSEFQNNITGQRQTQKVTSPQNNLTAGLPDNTNDDKRGGNSEANDEGTDDDGSCPEIEIVERRCKAVDMWVGNRAQIFYPLCIMHQICRACVQEEKDDRSCDKLFSSASRACEGHVGCIRAAHVARTTLSQLQPLVGTPGLCLCELQAQMRK
ncbi:uncharacterized protein LOC107226248 isoform X1 [Neodiprion lecontei]|uniref:Uncharacterized protein LOC107226248 isoform X1 n=1 Tax=Neodiprion lecontei TaxID=441921 RepID=A0A6J0C822_NEOLC|nr:uncharacterized protein LOC107226248 isoform X1 [Neodiprion lecontei]